METVFPVRELVDSAISAADPLVFLPEILRVEDGLLHIGDLSFDMGRYRSLYLVAVGKAAIRMSFAMNAILGEKIAKGVVLTKHPDLEHPLPERFEICFGGHPVPTEGSVSGSKKVFDLLSETGSEDLILFLISGGGSALLTAPREGITLSDMQMVTTALLRSGADIQEFNTVRKHLDQAKGGGLAAAASPSECVTIVLSDVIGSPLESIASGPTVPDNGTFMEAVDILKKYALWEEIPRSARFLLEKGCRGEIPETLKTEDPIFKKCHAFIAADNRRSATAAAICARGMGFDALVLTTALRGEASEIGAILPAFLSEIEKGGRPTVLIFGGETTVHLKGNGMGGRNTEMALGAVFEMSRHPNCALITLATDGEDGPTNAAGAIVTSKTFQRGLSLGMEPEEFLARNDAYHYFERVGGLLRIGPSGTNVNDLCFLIYQP